ncbi:flowering-related B-class MADS-box protein [Tripterygium wilfordii]|uniref:Flowering-related B-class MADS-box protein n=2 Tax=Mesangiospermae TaxID=1437183 RepID=A0A7J7CQ28_TRIWF|nr:flowering-related B-class MADS-box protein [Tripterygium wilfordii]
MEEAKAIRIGSSSGLRRRGEARLVTGKLRFDEEDDNGARQVPCDTKGKDLAGLSMVYNICLPQNVILLLPRERESNCEQKTIMGRGKIEIKKIENSTNRQVTYSKRRNGIFKKAQELTVLCDAKVSLIMFSSTGKFHEFISPNITTKKVYDLYQKALGIDLWRTHYERMQENLRKLKETNNRLRREIRHRMGEDLNGLSYQELSDLEQNMAFSVDRVRERKYHVLKTQTQTYTKKETKYEDPQYSVVDNEGVYESAMVLATGASNLYAFRLHHSHGGGGGGYGDHELRLA